MHPITGKKLAGPNAENGPPVEIGEDAYQDVPSIGRCRWFATCKKSLNSRVYGKR